jgi:phage terminase small subunit
MKRPDQLDDEAAAVLSGVDVTEQQTFEVDEDGNPHPVPTITKKAKVFDKMSALTLAMRHLGMLKEKVELTGKDGAPLVPANPIEMTDEQLAAIAAGSGAAVAGKARSKE